VLGDLHPATLQAAYLLALALPYDVGSRGFDVFSIAAGQMGRRTDGSYLLAAS